MSSSIAEQPTPWRTIILLCRKCSRKLDGGFGPKGKHTLRSELRDAAKAAGRRREVRVIETSCVGLCPKRAVTAINAGSPGTIYAVREGTAVEEALQLLAPTSVG